MTGEVTEFNLGSNGARLDGSCDDLTVNSIQTNGLTQNLANTHPIEIQSGVSGSAAVIVDDGGADGAVLVGSFNTMDISVETQDIYGPSLEAFVTDKSRYEIVSRELCQGGANVSQQAHLVASGGGSTPIQDYVFDIVARDDDGNVTDAIVTSAAAGTGIPTAATSEEPTPRTRQAVSVLTQI